jgi:hypothetical protein
MRYPGFSDEFIRTTREHITKANNSSSTTTKSNSTTDDNTSQLISGVVKLRI